MWLIWTHFHVYLFLDLLVNIGWNVRGSLASGLSKDANETLSFLCFETKVKVEMVHALTTQNGITLITFIPWENYPPLTTTNTHQHLHTAYTLSPAQTSFAICKISQKLFPVKPIQHTSLKFCPSIDWHGNILVLNALWCLVNCKLLDACCGFVLIV